jgi:pilus assembly protein CpaB
MKNTRTLAVLAVAIVSGLAAVMLASQWLNRQSATGVAHVAVAATEVSLGQRISPEMVKIVDWPSGSVPSGAIDDPNKLQGRVVRIALQRGEPILEGKLAPVGTQGGLSAVIGEGRRAITVRVNDVIGVAGFALPGNYVDIIVNTQKDAERNSNKDQAISKIVLEHILVLAVAQEASRDETKPRVVNAVTLEVTPEEAEKIDLARSVGNLSLVLRNQVDPADATTAGATKASLLDLKESAQADAKKPSTAGGKTSPQKVAHKVKGAITQITQADTTRQAAGSSAAPPATPSGSCVGVINGLRNSQECY